MTPPCYGRHVVSLSFFWCSTGALGSILLGAGFLYCILASSLDLNSSGPKGPFGLMWLSLPHFFSNCLVLYWQLHWHLGRRTQLEPDSVQLARRTQLSYIIVRRPLDLWNRMFNRHQAEITVMQFRGHSLPVHHSVVYHGNFFSSSHFISQFPPTRYPLITAIRMCHFLPVHHLECRLWPGQNTTLCCVATYNCTCTYTNMHLHAETSITDNERLQ